MTELKTKLTSTPQREDSGASTNSRYHYQALCGLLLVLERHKLGNEYALVFEYHDDIAIFDHRYEPERVRFYQVKSKKSGNWTPASLTKRDTKKKKDAQSILGKMYDNVVTFGEAVERSTFLTNAPANFAPLGKETFCLDECEADTLTEIVKKIEDESSAEDAIKSELLWIERTNLSLDDADTHAKGKLEAFVVESLGHVEFSLSALFKAVSEECDTKSRATDVDLTNFDQVVQKRGLTREVVDGWLEAVSSTVNCPRWEEVSPDISLPALEKIRVAREWNSYRVEVLNPNEAVRKVRRLIAGYMQNCNLEGMAMDELLKTIFNGVVSEAKAELAAATDEKIKAMILYETHSIQ